MIVFVEYVLIIEFLKLDIRYAILYEGHVEPWDKTNDERDIVKLDRL